MWSGPSRAKIRAMSSYAVFWRNGGIAFHGRLEFDPYGLWLHGGEPGHQLRVEVPYDEIVRAERAGDRIGPCPAIRIHTRAAGTLLIASIGGVGVLSEILETLHRNARRLADASELVGASGASACR
jgi:hypothetical protein